MLLGCIADDFTGASDLANTLARGTDGKGMSVTQFIGVPRGNASTSCETGVVALKTRSIPVEDAVAQSLAALDWLKRQGCRQFLFKYCSTFDSTPEGNIGPVAEALADRLGAKGVVVCPVFPGAGRTLFMGHLFVNDRLLSESGMEKHPLTPMTDPDIRRWLRRQTKSDVGHVPHSVVAKSHEAIRDALNGEMEASHTLVVADAISNADLLAIGEAVANDMLITGGSGIALGLPANFRKAGLIGNGASAFSPRPGPGLALCGSCSKASLDQVAVHAKTHPAMPLDPVALMEGTLTPEILAEWALGQIDQHPIIYSTATSEAVGTMQARFGRELVAERIEAAFGEIARMVVSRGVTRLVVGGGETSGAVIKSLGVTSLAIGPEIDPGVPAMMEEGTRGLRLSLKSGNFGSTDFFAKALAVLGGR
ncbi:MAG: 3-oxo-tetronate kinase [Bosea sp. (in: a-proteobacteria)]